jgi:glycosyltransferase involved in cell wall biosynthesis
MSAAPKVSVVVSTYNRHARLVEALAGVFAQTWRNLEVIVVNDGSTEPQYATVPRPDGVIWIDLPRNTRETHGYPCLGHVRNVGIARASGEYLAFLDDDDVWLPAKIEKQLAAIHGTQIEMSCTEIYAGDGAPCGDLEYPLYYRDHLKLDLPALLTHEHVRSQNYITHSSVIMRRSLFDRAGPYLEIPLQGHVVDGERVVEDWALWRSCFRYTRCRYLHEPLVYYDCKFRKLTRLRNRARIAALRACRSLFGRPATIAAGY